MVSVLKTARTGPWRWIALTGLLLISITFLVLSAWEQKMDDQIKKANEINRIFDAVPIPSGYQEELSKRYEGPFGWAGEICLGQQGCPHVTRYFIGTGAKPRASFNELNDWVQSIAVKENVPLTCYESSEPSCYFSSNIEFRGSFVSIDAALNDFQTPYRLVVTIQPLKGAKK